jgi:hypothetical protein
MNPISHDLQSLATAEELKYRARDVLESGRPVFLSVVISLLSIVITSFASGYSKLPWAVELCLAIAAIGVPALVLEVRYLNRRLEALIVLQGLSRKSA